MILSFNVLMRVYSSVEYIESNFPEILFCFPDSFFASFQGNIFFAISLHTFSLILFDFSSSEALIAFIMNCMWYVKWTWNVIHPSLSEYIPMLYMLNQTCPESCCFSDSFFASFQENVFVVF